MTTFVPRSDAEPFDADVIAAEQTVLTPWGAHVLVPRGTALVSHGNYVVPIPAGLMERWFVDRQAQQRAEEEREAEERAGIPPDWYQKLEGELEKDPTKEDLVEYARTHGGVALDMQMLKAEMVETINRTRPRRGRGRRSGGE